MGFIILSIGEDNYILFPIRFLIVLSIFGGSILIWLIFPFFNLILLSLNLKLLTLIICFLGLLFGIFVFNKNKINIINFILLKYKFYLSLIWFIPIIFCYFLNFFFLNLINNYKFFLDLGWIEFLGGRFFLKNFNYNYFLTFFKFNNFFLLLIFIIFFII